MVSKILLWLFVINLGIVFGAGLYEARIEFPHWLIYSEPEGYRWSGEAARQANSGVRFWVYVTTVPLTLLTLANLIVAWRARRPIRPWWLGAAAVALADRVFTFTYFVPTMVNLMSDESLPQVQAVATASRWGQLNYLRHVIVLVAWLLALKAFSLLCVAESEKRVRCYTFALFINKDNTRQAVTSIRFLSGAYASLSASSKTISAATASTFSVPYVELIRQR